jgi:hypothetical protein
MPTMGVKRRKFNALLNNFNNKFSTLKTEICQAPTESERESLAIQLQELVDGFVSNIRKQNALLHKSGSSVILPGPGGGLRY